MSNNMFSSVLRSAMNMSDSDSDDDSLFDATDLNDNDLSGIGLADDGNVNLEGGKMTHFPVSGIDEHSDSIIKEDNNDFNDANQETGGSERSFQDILQEEEEGVVTEEQTQDYPENHMDATDATETQQESQTEVAEHSQREMETEAYTQQIVRLNEIISRNEEEKQSLENRVRELDEELGELKKSIHDPNNYYQQELSKSIDERIALEDMNQQMHEELTLLKATVSEKIASLLLIVLLMIRLVGVRIVDRESS